MKLDLKAGVELQQIGAYKTTPISDDYTQSIKDEVKQLMK